MFGTVGRSVGLALIFLELENVYNAGIYEGNLNKIRSKILHLISKIKNQLNAGDYS